MKYNLLLLFTTITFNLLFSQQNIESKFTIHEGFEREIINDYHRWIIKQKLKKNNKVFYTDGSEKVNKNIWAAVFEYDLGTYKYHQCADAAIYLNAMYKYELGKIDQLVYSFTNGDKSSYTEWLDGVNYKLDPDNINKLNKVFGAARKDNLATFYEWLKSIWTWAGTTSLNYDTIEVDIINLRPGDIFNQGGHAISVVDVILNKKTGDKKFMLSQSFMIDPRMGDEQHILLNPRSGDVWYDLNSNYVITPEWSMSPKIIRFK